MITEWEKEYYNMYLAVSRSCRNKPFTIRKNFEDFEDAPEYIHVRRICSFLRQFPQIKPRIFFQAPYELYKDLDYIDLKFFTTQKAVKTYTLYMRQLQEESPDSEHHIEFIKNSLRFVGLFCIKNKIPIEKYPTHSGGATYSWMKHVKEHNISIYVMFDFTEIFGIIYATPNDELDLLLGNVAVGLAAYKNRFDTSKEARRIVREGFKRIKTVVDKSIQGGTHEVN